MKGPMVGRSGFPPFVSYFAAMSSTQVLNFASATFLSRSSFFGVGGVELLQVVRGQVGLRGIGRA